MTPSESPIRYETGPEDGVLFVKLNLKNQLKVHKIENFLTPILEFALFLC